jgi:NAD-reducing hydrogenase small subunit
VDPVSRARFATVWLGGCSGCHMSFLDLDERLIELAARADVRYSPLVDAKDFPEVDVTLVEGAVANRDHLEQARIVRARSRIVVSFGDCAVTGNVTALRNPFALEDVLDRAYRETAALVRGVPGGAGGDVPELLPRVVPLHQVVAVDHFLPGCPPPADAIAELVFGLLDGRPPAETRRFG